MVDTIPQEVLADYQSRTIKSAKNLRWADAGHTMIDADVLFEELQPMGYIPFSAGVAADTKHGEQFWQKAQNGDYGSIAAFVQPTQAQVRQAMPTLSARQFRLAMHRAGKLTLVPGAIAAMPQPMRGEAEIEWEYATEFRRDHPLIEPLAGAIGLTPAQVDALWATGAQIT